ncbi:hypothetical protein KC357_g233 [Hortaea werneckii]|nr:hypothetical protein KC357_g233 [Hortaea werneckii]
MPDRLPRRASDQADLARPVKRKRRPSPIDVLPRAAWWKGGGGRSLTREGHCKDAARAARGRAGQPRSESAPPLRARLPSSRVADFITCATRPSVQVLTGAPVGGSVHVHTDSI